MPKINHAFLKTHNSHLVLKTIYEAGAVSRAEIVHRTHLTPPTVSGLVAGLLETGLVEEIGFGLSRGGKRPILLRVVDTSRYIIGLDLGRGDFRGGVIDLRGKVHDRKELPLSTRKGEIALKMVYELVDDLVQRAASPLPGSPLLGIGIGAPGLVDHHRGIIHRAVNVEWQDIPLRSLLYERYKIPVYMANDCQIAALAEYTFGEHVKGNNLAVLNIGYGVGAGIIINGQLMQGLPYGAGEIGHVKIVENGEPCQCGNTGCLETVASVRAILRRARALAPERAALYQYEAAASPTQAMETMVDQLAAGDPVIHQVLDETAQYLAITISHLVSMMGPCRIVIAGNIARLGNPLVEKIKIALYQRYRLPPVEETTLEITRFGADLVLLGGAALVMPSELGALW